MTTATLPASSRRKLTPPQLAKQWGIDVAKVLHWIRSGELRAIDACTRRGSRPRYLIDQADIAVFEERRSVQPPTPSPRRRRKVQEHPQGFVEYFK